MNETGRAEEDGDSLSTSLACVVYETGSAEEDRGSPSTSLESDVDETGRAEEHGDSSSTSSASVVVRALVHKRGNELCRKEEERKYNCQECDYAATKPALLIQHLRAHSEEAHFMMIRSDQRLHTGSHPNSEVKCAIGPPD